MKRDTRFSSSHPTHTKLLRSGRRVGLLLLGRVNNRSAFQCDGHNDVAKARGDRVTPREETIRQLGTKRRRRRRVDKVNDGGESSARLGANVVDILLQLSFLEK